MQAMVHPIDRREQMPQTTAAVVAEVLSAEGSQRGSRAERERKAVLSSPMLLSKKRLLFKSIISGCARLTIPAIQTIILQAAGRVDAAPAVREARTIHIRIQ